MNGGPSIRWGLHLNGVIRYLGGSSDSARTIRERPLAIRGQAPTDTLVVDRMVLVPPDATYNVATQEAAPLVQ